MNLEIYDNSWFDRGAPRWKEALWQFTSIMCFRLPVPLPSSIRVFLLRLFGAHIGTGVVVRSGVNITFPWRLSIGDHVWIGEQVTILSLAPVNIGSHVCISQQAFLCTGSHQFLSPGFDLIVSPISVLDRSWVAAKAFVGAGTTVGPDSVVGAGAVVVRNVPPGHMALGSPAVPREITPGQGAHGG